VKKWVTTVLAVGGVSVALCGLAFADDPAFVYGSSDADSVAVLSGLPGYKNAFWWDHTNLTVAVRASASVDQEKFQAMRDAIGVWTTTLASQIPQISLTDVTDSKDQGTPDIILRYVPHAGGTQWGGVANCGAQHCLNVIVKSDLPEITTSQTGEPDFDALRVYRTALHELGHTLGLGHASPLEQSSDLMGYGWALHNPDLVPILSDCDLKGIRAAFSWVFANEAAHPSPVGEVTC
jgi:hypothetical protein